LSAVARRAEAEAEGWRFEVGAATGFGAAGVDTAAAAFAACAINEGRDGTAAGASLRGDGVDGEAMRD